MVHLVDPLAAYLNPRFGFMYVHMQNAAVESVALFMAGVAAYYVFRHHVWGYQIQHIDFWETTLKIALVTLLITAPLQVLHGDLYARHVYETQPQKFAAMEAVWETESYVPEYLIAVPTDLADLADPRAKELFGIPGGASWLASGGDPTAEITGLEEFDSEPPPVAIVFWAFARLFGECGIDPDTTLVVYGDNANWFATHLYWMCSYYGHDDVRVMDGGRDFWMENGYPVSDTVPSVPAVEYSAEGRDESVRAYREDVLEALGTDTVFVDVRMPEEYRGELTAPPGYNEAARRGGHIPGAVNVLWADNMRPGRLFNSPAELRSLYADHGIDADTDVITYCRIGERSSVAWFALTQLLGYDSVRNYDGSWVEWGNMVDVPIERGA